jgi:hypothetical protein
VTIPGSDDDDNSDSDCSPSRSASSSCGGSASSPDSPTAVLPPLGVAARDPSLHGKAAKREAAGGALALPGPVFT